MKINKKIKYFMFALFIAITLCSCNTDMGELGIFNSIKNSRPNANYKLKKLAGKLTDDNFIVETENGIEILSNDGTRTTLISSTNPSVKFIEDNIIYYTSNAKLYKAVLNDSKDAVSSTVEITMKGCDSDDLSTSYDIDAIESSFFENGLYLIKVKDTTGHYHFVKSNDKNIDGTVYTFKNTINVKDTSSAPVYLGNNHYYTTFYVNNSEKNYKLYKFGSDTPIVIGENNFTSIPLASVNVGGKDYIFTNDDKIYSISDHTATLLSGQTHSIIFTYPNQLVPMVKVGDTIHGVYANKPFTFDGTTFTSSNETLGTNVTIIGLVYIDNKYYAFSADNGIYKSSNGISFDPVI